MSVEFIEIKKQLVIYHAESAIRKVLDVKLMSHTLPGYHLQTDQGVEIDYELLHRIMERWDAEVRVIMRKYITDETGSADDELQDEEESFFYYLNMPDTWYRSLLQPLATYIHNFLVFGIIYDFLKDKMPDVAQVYLPDIEEMKEKIENALSQQSGLYKTPLQPF